MVEECLVEIALEPSELQFARFCPRSRVAIAKRVRCDTDRCFVVVREKELLLRALRRVMNYQQIMKTFVCVSLMLCGGNAVGRERWTDRYEPLVFEGMPCRLMKPIDFAAKQSFPVIISLHGAGGTGVDNMRNLRDWNRQLAEKKRREEFPAYVVAPQSKGMWNVDHLKKIKSLIKTLPQVDMKRIYIMGHSMGGHGAYILIQIDPEYFAAAAPSAGSGRTRTKDFIDAAKISDLPIWAFHGDKDRVCPIEKDQKVFDEIKALGGKMKLTTWVGDKHGVSGKMIVGAENGRTQLSSERCDAEADFMTWLFLQSR